MGPTPTDPSIMFPFWLLVGLVAAIGGFLLGALVSAMWLRLAALLLKLGNISFLTAFKAVLLANFTVGIFNAAIGANHSFMLAMARAQQQPGRGFGSSIFESDQFIYMVISGYNPTYMLYSSLFGLLLTAVIFCRVLPGENNAPLTFRDSIALSALYFAISFVFLLLVGVLVYVSVYGLLGLME